MNRSAANLAGFHLDYQVRRVGPGRSKGRGSKYRVEAAVRWAPRDLEGHEFRIELLDRNMEPLVRPRRRLDYGVLPSLVWNGMRSVFRTEQFTTGSAAPAFLVVFLGQGQRVLKLQDGKQPPPPPKEPEPAKPAEPAPEMGGKCCLVSLSGPKQPLTTKTEPVPFFPSVEITSEPWKVDAKFGQKDGDCRCTCCEYRQYVKGEMTATDSDGAPYDISPPSDYTRPKGIWDPKSKDKNSESIHRLNETSWVEDTIGDPKAPGDPLRYGPRAFRSGIYQDYPDPCTYWAGGHYSLRIPTSVKFGTMVEINLDFKGQVVDTCDKLKPVGKPIEWAWKFREEVR